MPLIWTAEGTVEASPIPPSPTWQNVVGATDTSGLLVKTASGGWGNCGAASNESFAGDCQLTIYIEDVTVEYFVGVDPSNSCTTYSTVDFAIHANLIGSGEVAIWESGSFITNGTVPPGQKLMVVIERVGTDFDYYYLAYVGTRPLPNDAGRVHWRGPISGTASTLFINTALEINPDGEIDAANLGWQAI
jgi:hypothetical protein